MRTLHSLDKVEKPPNRYEDLWWVTPENYRHDNTYCSSNMVREHHACARDYFENPEEQIYFCECSTCWQNSHRTLSHYFITYDDSTICQYCQNGEHPVP
jgi:hypothetical protein